MLNKSDKIYLYSKTEIELLKMQADDEIPYIEYYPSNGTSTNKTAILICPGGAYTKLSWELEGTTPALFFNKNEIDIFILHYRLNNEEQKGYLYPAQYNDANKALQIIHELAPALQINKQNIGIMGFSAGGHLAATVSTLNAKSHAKKIPAFSILIYPVITMEEPYVHKLSRRMVLGESPTKNQIHLLSAEKNITPNTPPTILIHAFNDELVSVQNSILYFQQLLHFNIQSALFIYDHGGHGFGIPENDKWLYKWPEQVISWMHSMKLC